jgi:hypothetical protein
MKLPNNLSKTNALEPAALEADLTLLPLANDTALNDDGWCLIAPFGEWPKTRVYRENGQVKEQQFIQVLDHASADALVSKENSFFGKLKRAFIGVPVFKGHGDLNEIDPQAISSDRAKIKLGVVDQIRKSPRGLEAHFALDHEGAEAVRAGWKFPSGFWYVQPGGTRPLRDGTRAILARPFKLISVALTQFPNISGVESLANAGPAATPPREETKPINETSDMKLITGWLLAQGVALANTETPTETQILEAMQKLQTTHAGQVTALDNEKTSLASAIVALTNERDTHARLAQENAAALAQEQAARQTERSRAAAAVADLALYRGLLTVADRAGMIAALENSRAFDTDQQALLARPVITKTTTNHSTESGKLESGLTSAAAKTQAEYEAAFQTELIAAGQNPVQAHRNIMVLPKYAGLAARLVPNTY